MKESIEIERLRNIFRFALCICADSSVMKSSPDYIMEKYNKFIGVSTNDSIEGFDSFNEYIKIWGEGSNKVKNQVIFLHLFEVYSKRIIDISNIIDYFERYIGSINKVSGEEISGLHTKLEMIIKSWINTKSIDVKILRDIKLKELNVY
jgi:hypothetical protein